MQFVEAFRQFQYNVGKDNFALVHVSLIIETSGGEQKTKPTQQVDNCLDRFQSISPHLSLSVSLCVSLLFSVPLSYFADVCVCLCMSSVSILIFLIYCFPSSDLNLTKYI